MPTVLIAPRDKGKHYPKLAQYLITEDYGRMTLSERCECTEAEDAEAWTAAHTDALGLGITFHGYFHVAG